MGIEVLTADAQGSENLQRWAAMGLPVPPSWRVGREVVQDNSPESLAQQLRALPRMFSEDRYWVLQQGPMNPDSRILMSPWRLRCGVFFSVSRGRIMW